MLDKLMCLLLFYLFIYSFIYLLAAGEGTFFFFFFFGGVWPEFWNPYPYLNFFLRQKIIWVVGPTPRIFLTEIGPMFRPQGFLLKSPYALTCEYSPGTVGHYQVKSSPGVKCSESESAAGWIAISFLATGRRVNSHSTVSYHISLVLFTRPLGQ